MVHNLQKTSTTYFYTGIKNKLLEINFAVTKNQNKYFVYNLKKFPY